MGTRAISRVELGIYIGIRLDYGPHQSPNARSMSFGLARSFDRSLRLQLQESTNHPKCQLDGYMWRRRRFEDLGTVGFAVRRPCISLCFTAEGFLILSPSNELSVVARSGSVMVMFAHAPPRWPKYASIP